MRAAPLALALALAAAPLCGCTLPGADQRDPVVTSGARTVEAGDRLVQALRRVESADAAFLGRLAAASTVNLDAPGLAPRASLAPDAARTPSWAPVLSSRGTSGLAICVSQPGATFTLDGWAPEPILDPDGPHPSGWRVLVKPVAPGAHTLRIEREGYFPVETPVVVFPGLFEVVAVRLGKVVSSAGPARPGGK